MDGFVASNYSFSHFNGVRYIYSFDKFFSDYDIAQKTVADPCDNGSVITNAGQSGYGGIRDIPVTNNLQTDVELYDFSQSNASDSFTLFFNSYDDVSNADTSYGDTVQTELIQVTSNDNPNTVIQLPPLGTNSSGAITLARTTVSKARTTKNTEGTLTGCTITITREYSAGTVVTIDYNCLQAPLKPVYSNKSTSGDCPENEGETGVLTTSAMVAEIVEAYGLSTLTKERLMYLNSSPYTSDIYNYLKNNNFSSQAMEYSLFAIDSLIDGTFNNYREITEKEQNYRADMSKSELAMFDSMPKADQFKYLKSALVAINKSAELFPLNERTNGKGDAFRHAYWNALAT